MKIFIIVCAVVLFLILIFFTVRFMIKYYTDKKLEDYQNALLKQHYEEVESMYRQVRGWRHDYKNHIQTMKAHLQMKEYDLLDNYLKTLNADLMEIDTVLKTGNVMIDAILNSKLVSAKGKGINIKADAQVPATLTVTETDLCVVIGNLIDNAIESVMQIENEEDRFIRIYIGVFKGQLYISVTNSVGGKLKKSGKEYFSTKGKSHGYGLKRIDTIAAKYSGYVNRQDEKDVFATEVMLPL